MRLSGSVKFFCAFGSGASGGGAAGLPGFLRPSASRFFCRLGPRLPLGLGGGSRLGLQFGLGCADLFGAPLLVGDPVRHLFAALVAPEGGVLAGVRHRRGVHPTRDLGLQFRRAFGHPLVAHRFVLGGVGLDLRPVQRHVAELDQPGPLAQPQHLRKQRRKRRQMTLAEIRDRTEIRRVEADDAHEVDAFPTGLGDPPRRVDPVAIAVEQQRRHHRRIERRLPAIDAVHPLDRLQIDLLDHQVQDEPRQVVLVDELLNRRRQQHRLVDLPGAIALAHAQAESDLPRKRQPIPRFLRQAPGRSRPKRSFSVCSDVNGRRGGPLTHGNGLGIQERLASCRSGSSNPS